jgi:hypothetical protein
MKFVEVVDHAIRLGSIAEPIPTAVLLDCLHEVRRSAVVQEEHSLAEAPQWRAPELGRARQALADAVGQPRAHVVDQQIGVKIDRLIA